MAGWIVIHPVVFRGGIDGRDNPLTEHLFTLFLEKSQDEPTIFKN